MDERTKELIAIGASITAHCQPCLEYHLAGARQAGAEEEEIREAVEVGRQVRKGAAAKFDAFTRAAMAVCAPAVETEGGCGCG